MGLSALTNRFTKKAAAAVVAGGLLAVSFGGAATAQNLAATNQNQQAAVPQTISAPAHQSTAPEIKSVDKRAAWKASKENGGTLVIWYDARNHYMADIMVKSLKELGKQNVVALAGRDDGNFVLIGNGRTIPYQFSLREARDGTLLDEAEIFANQRNIAALDLESSDRPDRSVG